jgi:radical SAM superfamily enzyme YgiQ (UPF0313 family)
MKIILIAMDINEKTIQEVATPFGLMYISSYLKDRLCDDVEIKIVDGTLADLPEDADMVGISVMTPYFARVSPLAKKIKARSPIPVIVGGHHISALPASLPEYVDVGVIGEGEETFLELVKLWSEKGSFESSDLERIDGIVYRDNGVIKMTSPRPPAANIDQIPFPDRTIWDVEHRVKHIISARGCPFNCVFCAMAGSRYRVHSAEYVLKELSMLWERYSPPQIIFLDDLFTTQKERLGAIAEGIRAMDLHRKTTFSVSLRADLINEEVMETLKSMNVVTVFMGIESASEPMLKYYKSGTVTLRKIEDAIDLCKRYGMSVLTSYIIGAPKETAKDLYATYQFIVDHYKDKRIAGAALCTLTPYPCSQVWEYAKKRGLVSDDMDFSRLSITLSDFNPHTYPYLNEVIPLEEFVDYVDLFEDLHYRINVRKYRDAFKSFAAIEKRLDRERIAKFKAERTGSVTGQGSSD